MKEDRAYKLILWGYGMLYNRNQVLLRLFEQQGEIEIVALTATTLPLYREIDGVPVVPCEELEKLTFDYILVFNNSDFNEIVQHIVQNLGIRRELILSHKILDIPNFSFRRYCSIKERRPTILANTCWGGFAYRYLGMECISPFKNLWLTQEDYFQVIQNLEEYVCQQDPVFHHMGKDQNSGLVYPVLSLKDIKLHCNHETDPDRAIADWIRRREKMNLDYIVVEFFSESGRTSAAFLDLDIPYQKICFITRKLDIPGAIYIPPNEGESALDAIHGTVLSIGRSVRVSLLDLLEGNIRYRSLTDEEVHNRIENHG